VYAVSIYANTIDKTSIAYAATEQVRLEDIRAKIGQESMFEKKERIVFRSFDLEGEEFSSSPFVFINAMAFTGMLNRTACASIVYPVLFPEFLDYYPFDYGRGPGTDDSTVVYSILNPGYYGSMSAPFYVVFYSQGGLAVSVIGSFIVGFLMGFFWNMLIRSGSVSLPGSVFGGLVFFACIMVALTSPRDSIMSTYGVIYPLAFFLLFYLANNIVAKLLEKFTKTKVITDETSPS